MQREPIANLLLTFYPSLLFLAWASKGSRESLCRYLRTTLELHGILLAVASSFPLFLVLLLRCFSGRPLLYTDSQSPTLVLRVYLIAYEAVGLAYRRIRASVTTHGDDSSPFKLSTSFLTIFDLLAPTVSSANLDTSPSKKDLLCLDIGFEFLEDFPFVQSLPFRSLSLAYSSSDLHVAAQNTSSQASTKEQFQAVFHRKVDSDDIQSNFLLCDNFLLCEQAKEVHANLCESTSISAMIEPDESDLFILQNETSPSRFYANLELISVNHLRFQLCIATDSFEPCRAVTPLDSTRLVNIETSPSKPPQLFYQSILLIRSNPCQPRARYSTPASLSPFLPQPISWRIVT